MNVFKLNKYCNKIRLDEYKLLTLVKVYFFKKLNKSQRSFNEDLKTLGTKRLSKGQKRKA